MKQVLVLGVLLACGAALAAAENGDTMSAAVFDKWLTTDTVNFENLRYGGTYTVLVFWSQGVKEVTNVQGTTTTAPPGGSCDRGAPQTRQ
ncbi:MAG: hypothetical protein ABIF71_13730 [Planctomycetota bacterium]